MAQVAGLPLLPHLLLLLLQQLLVLLLKQSLPELGAAAAAAGLAPGWAALPMRAQIWAVSIFNCVLIFPCRRLQVLRCACLTVLYCLDPEDASSVSWLQTASTGLGHTCSLALCVNSVPQWWSTQLGLQRRSWSVFRWPRGMQRIVLCNTLPQTSRQVNS